MRDEMEMSNRLRRLEELYEGDAPPHEDLDSEEGRETATLRAMKDLLDRRPKRRPDAAVLESVFAAARGEVDVNDAGRPIREAPRGDRVDRPPVARQRSTILRIGATSAVAVLMLFAVGIFQLELFDSSPLTAPTDAEQGAASRPSASAERAADPDALEEPAVEPEPYVASDRSTLDRVGASQPGASQAGTPQAGTPQAGAPQAGAPQPRASLPAASQPDESFPSASRMSDRLLAGGSQEMPARARAALPGFADELTAADDEYASTLETLPASAPEDPYSWDHRTDVVEVYQHIEFVGGGVERGWGPAPVPLEVIPATNTDTQPFLRPAGERHRP